MCAQRPQVLNAPSPFLYHSLPILLRQDIYLNLEFMFFQLDWKPPSPCDSPISEPLRAGFLKDCQDTWVVMWVLGPELQA